MNPRWRYTLLALAPLPIVAASVGVSHWARSAPQELPADNDVVRSTRGTSGITVSAPSVDARLVEQCRRKADALRPQLGPECHDLVEPPFVMAGDMDEPGLRRWYTHTIGPASRVMAKAYFRSSPTEPITVLLFRSEKSYDHYAKQLFGDSGISVYGYYKPAQRTLVMNIGTGGGTLVHELTHALIDFDFSAVPDWFNEGLASLHEACHILEDEGRIEGLTNWRLPKLQETIRAGNAPALEQLLAKRDFRGEDVGLHYALARYFCMYMQHERVLEKFYREFRDGHKDDLTGARTVEKVFPKQSWAELNSRFQTWVLALEWKRN